MIESEEVSSSSEGEAEDKESKSSRSRSLLPSVVLKVERRLEWEGAMETRPAEVSRR